MCSLTDQKQLEPFLKIFVLFRAFSVAEGIMRLWKRNDLNLGEFLSRLCLTHSEIQMKMFVFLFKSKFLQKPEFFHFFLKYALDSLISYDMYMLFINYDFLHIASWIKYITKFVYFYCPCCSKFICNILILI